VRLHRKEASIEIRDSDTLPQSKSFITVSRDRGGVGVLSFVNWRNVLLSLISLISAVHFDGPLISAALISAADGDENEKAAD
jgi:hypothetical protein